jgi:glycosyltransferase involved in cell wall biosynthesis
MERLSGRLDTSKGSIAFLAATYARSGTEQMVLDLASRFVADGHRVITVIPNVPELDSMAHDAQVIGANPVRVGRLFEADRNVMRNLAELYSVFRTNMPSVVHFHMPWAPVCFESILAARLARVPYLIRTEHNPIMERFSLKQRVKMRILDALVQRIVFVSKGNLERHVKNGARSAEKACVIPNGIDVSKVRSDHSVEWRSQVRTELRLPQTRHLAVMVAALSRRKGVLDFVRAAQIACRLEPGLEFVVVGDGPSRREAEELADQLGLLDKIHFVGHRADVAQILVAFDIYVQPSHYEGLSIAMLEALAAGLPMVTTDVDGVADVLPGGLGAVTVEVGDVEGLALGVVKLATDPKCGQELASVSQTRVREHFTNDAMYERYKSLYASMGVAA